MPEAVGGWTIFGERSAYDSPWMRVKLVDVEAPEGKRFDYHIVELSRVAVALIVDPDDRVLLLWKYRFPAAQWGYEAPGGMVDEGEAPVTAAAREAAEETGWHVSGEPEHLLSLEPLPGQVRARVDAYLWRGATRVGGPTDPAEDGVATWVDVARIPELVASGQILGAATATALMYLYARDT
ncbi:ADP-ribose pyrophosphatase YjhB (NUDIX family) [Actinomycetospora succinea]|uniref:ADP-ribose pyrophosphatase YjhB (NUDIX family) n=1 Tax=Actinomycetospora succinea TaxID=663603 RepID=A0A4R6UNF7_9PSEU|nr:NUDIX domain-containing protein [Actinomycetospora succinea]TDQ47013.1 ADP-ribose pyrophosphatase YjhB (NUDIX family) [Actinomycetospora succinea]